MAERSEHFKHLEPVLARFRLILPGLCTQLGHHHALIVSCKGHGNIRALHAEQLAASRTVKKVKKALKELEQIESSVREEEIQFFQQLATPLRLMAYEEMVRLVELDSEIDDVSHFNIDEVPASNGQQTTFQHCGDDPQEEPRSLQVAQQVEQQAGELAILEDTAQSWNQLQSDIQDVAEIMQEFSKVVHEQSDVLDTIEANVEQAAEDTRVGLLELVKARRAKIAGGTLTAAALGAVIGGPVGMLAGFKVAGVLTAALGGYMGYRGAGYINNVAHSDVVGLEAPKPAAFSDDEEQGDD